MPHSVRDLGVMDLNWTVEFRAGRGREGKWGRRRTAAETVRGGSDRNSLSIKKDREVERDRHSQPKRQWATDRGEEEGGGSLWKPSPSVMRSWKSSNCSWEVCGGLFSARRYGWAALLPAMPVAHHSVKPVLTHRWGPAGTLTFYVGSH